MLHFLQAAAAAGVAQEQLGVISPYRSQVCAKRVACSLCRRSMHCALSGSALQRLQKLTLVSSLHLLFNPASKRHAAHPNSHPAMLLPSASFTPPGGAAGPHVPRRAPGRRGGADGGQVPGQGQGLHRAVAGEEQRGGRCG